MEEEKRQVSIEFVKPVAYISIDIESSSGHNMRPEKREIDSTSGDIIGIGAALMTFDYKKKECVVHDNLLIKLYCPKKVKGTNEKIPYVATKKHFQHVGKKPTEDYTIFSEDCYNNFWGRDEGAKKALPLLEISKKERKTLFRNDREKKAIKKLVKFLDDAVNWSVENGYKPRLLSDNASFDFGNIDQLILKYLPDTKGTLHSGGSWMGAVRCVTSKEETILGIRDYFWMRRIKNRIINEKGEKESSDITARLHYIHGVPECTFDHTHLPDDDAKNIGWRGLIVQAIEDGVFPLIEERVETPPDDLDQEKPFYSLPFTKKQKI
jgi:hypothetical protein